MTDSAAVRPQQRNRLKPINVDYLESIGLPSKGDKSLLDFKKQEEYFAKIVERYNQFVSNYSPEIHHFDQAIAALSLDDKPAQYSMTKGSISDNGNSKKSQDAQLQPTSNELPTLLLAMRKIREAIIASTRLDDFALDVYTSIIRATIPLQHMESYHPALLHLLHKIHPITPLPEPELHEFLGYLLLDLACRQDDLAAACHTRCTFRYRDPRVEAVLRALVSGNWYVFWSLTDIVTERQRSLMGWAEGRMRVHALKCLGRSYLSVDRPYLETSARCRWEMLKEKESLGWQLDGGIVTIRRIGRK